nr:hypothetical protein [Candidatus Njordarchaeota archaeon]
MPAEKREERPEKAENPCEEDRGSDHVEWCLKQFEGTMNHPTTSNEVMPEKAKPEEYRVNAEKGNQPANSKSEKFSTEGSKLEQKNEQDANPERAIIAEHPQRLEEQQRNNSPESSQHSEAPLAERSNFGHVKEVDSSARHIGDYQEEKHDPLRLSEDPKAFVEGNRELLAKQGIIPEKDEAKLDDRTTLKFDVNEGLTIIHKDQTYKITTVEQERIGDLELRRYKTGQGEEFIHIPRENTTIPPYETPWYALPRTTYIYLDKECKHKLLEAAIDKAGRETTLRRELEERGTHISSKCLYRHLDERVDGMRVDRLIPILTYLSRNLDEPNSHITAIGDKRAVENPNLPFKLDTVNGARLHAARFSDGSLSASRGRGPTFEYKNTDAEQRNRIAESLTNVFGKANINTTEDKNEVPRVRTSTEVIGYVLQRSGAIAGEITVKNPDIPTFIRQGSIEMKREWIKQAFGDEGAPWPQRGLVMLSRSVDVTHRLSDEQRKRLDVMSEEWKKTQPKGEWKEKKYCMFDKLPDDIKEALEPERPRLLESEERMLEDDFGINVNKYPSEIHTREGGYSVSWVLQTASREDSRVFCDKIGFPQNRKQEELRRALRIK